MNYSLIELRHPPMSFFGLSSPKVFLDGVEQPARGWGQRWLVGVVLANLFS